MAKKKHKKKHNFQHKNAPAAVAGPVVTEKDVSTSKVSGKPSTMPNEWSEVASDVRRSLVLAGIFIVLMIGLWYVLDVTTFGQNFYKSIKL